MAQRGGSVISTVRYGKQVWSPVSPRADIVIATERSKAGAPWACWPTRGRWSTRPR